MAVDLAGAFQSLFQVAFGIYVLATCPGTCRFAAVAIFDGILFHAIVFGIGTSGPATREVSMNRMDRIIELIYFDDLVYIRYCRY